MPQHRETRFLPYTQEQVFKVVHDVRAYPQFLPWCQATRVYDERAGCFTADVLIGYKVLRERYSSDVCHQGVESIDVHYRSGPFQKLTNTWRFEAAKGGCNVHFFIDFEFRGRLLQTLASALFHDVVRRMVTAFEARAHALYGGPATAAKGAASAV